MVERQTRMPYIDIRSDTVTQPTASMKKQLLEGQLGGYGQDDEYVMKLEKLAASIMGKEAASFVPSGCFGNQCSILTAGRPGGEIILSAKSHLIELEQGGIGAICRMLTTTVETDQNMFMGVHQVADILQRPRIPHSPSPLIFAIENPTSTGKVYPLQHFNELVDLAESQQLHIHMDGARIFNACAVLNVQPADLVSKCSSVLFCLSKGLCSPAGSVVVGSLEFISKFNTNRRMLGGLMCRPGIFASMGIIALQEMIPHIKQDHRIARQVAEDLSSLSWLKLMGSPHTNIIFFTFVDERMAKAANLQQYLLQTRKIKCLLKQEIGSPNRIVVHHYIREQEAKQIVEGFRQFYLEKVDALQTNP